MLTVNTLSFACENFLRYVKASSSRIFLAAHQSSVWYIIFQIIDILIGKITSYEPVISSKVQNKVVTNMSLFFMYINVCQTYDTFILIQ